jgi:Cft2 family RNA processing exonuclease
MYFTALGGAHEIGATCSLIEVGGLRLLVDCGMRLNKQGDEALPDFSLLGRIDAVLITHAHLDHTGSLPLLRYHFPNVPIYMTEPTRNLIEILLFDVARIAVQNAKKGGSKPHYTEEGVDWLLRTITLVPFETWLAPVPAAPDLKVYWLPAGHILGASCILIDSPEGKIMLSGDMCTVRQKTVEGIKPPPDGWKPDVLVLESTYGDGSHPKRANEERSMGQSIAEVVMAGGVALVPSFALGRAQEIILTLKDLQRSKVIPTFPIVVDGMVRAICDAYETMKPYLANSLQKYAANSRQPIFWGDNIIRADEMTRLTATTTPCCIVSSSGMLTGGPALGYAKRIVDNERNAIFFTGYVDEEAPGKRLMSLQRGDKMILDGSEVEVNCQVKKIHLSAHADQGQLCQQVSYFQPKAVILVHGEGRAIPGLRSKLMEKYVVWHPHNGERIEPLSTPNWISETKAQVVGAASERWGGKLEITDDEIVIRLDKGLLENPLWQQFYNGFDEVTAKFMGTRLTIKPQPKTELEASDEEV